MSKTLILKAYLDEGIPGPDQFEVVETDAPQLGETGILVQLLALSPDPFLRNSVRTHGGRPLGSPFAGFVAGKVLESRVPTWEKGDLFGAMLPFTTIQIIQPEQLMQTPMWKLTGIIDESQISLGVGILGMPGATAYGGLIDVLRPQKGEVIFINAASGAVGGLVGQLAKRVFDCKVIGSAGGPEKCKLITEKFGYDHAIDYKTLQDAAGLTDKLRQVAPKGLNMYFENVGGFHFDAAMASLCQNGRVALCGFISAYNEGKPVSPTIDVHQMIYKGLRLEGFISRPWLTGQRGSFLKEMAGWWKEGKLEVQETFFDGIEQWPLAFSSLFTGANVGKVVVRV